MLIYYPTGAMVGHYADAQDKKYDGYYHPNGLPVEALILVRSNGSLWQAEYWVLVDEDNHLDYEPFTTSVFGWTKDLPTAYRHALGWAEAEELPVLLPESHKVALDSVLTGREELNLEFIMKGGE